MKPLLFMAVFYVALVIYGVNVSYAGRGGACSDASCSEKQIATQLETKQSDEELVQKVQDALATLETKISQEKMNNMIQSAADKNPQIKELLAIIQEYGVLTDIELKDKETP